MTGTDILKHGNFEYLVTVSFNAEYCRQSFSWGHVIQIREKGKRKWIAPPEGMKFKEFPELNEFIHETKLNLWRNFRPM